MLKTSKLISLLLAVVMVFSVCSVAIVSAGAAAPEGTATIVVNGKSTSVHVGDTYRYTAYLNAADCAPYGVVNYLDGNIAYTGSVLTVKEFSFPNMSTAVGSPDGESKIKFNGQDMNNGYKFDSADSVLVTVDFVVAAEGEANVVTQLTDLGYDDGQSMVDIIYDSEVLTDPAPTLTEGLELVECPHGPATDTATVKILKVDGTVDKVKEFNVGDVFTVYTILNASNCQGDGYIGTLAGEQYYTDSVLSLQNPLKTSGTFKKLDDVFPVTGAVTVANALEKGSIYYAASTQELGEDAFAFDEPDSLLIKTQYKVENAGTAEITNNLITLGIADFELTRLVDESVVLDKDLIYYGTFDINDEPPTQAPETQAPATQAPETQAPETQAPETQAPETAAPETEAPETQAPETEAPAEKAIVKLVKIDGTVDKEKEFNVGDVFTVYTVLNAANAQGDGYIGTLAGEQSYTDSVLSLQNPVKTSGTFKNLNDVFPITGAVTVANATEIGKIYYAASTQEMGEDAFAFDEPHSLLIKTQYKVESAGTAEITNNLITLGIADFELTRIVDDSVILDDNLIFYGTFDLDDEPPTTPVVTPTETPETQTPETQAPETQAPETQAPETQAPETEAPGKTIVKIVKPDGTVDDEKEFNVGDVFTVYTVLNAANAQGDGYIGTLSGGQYFTDSVLSLQNQLKSSGTFKDLVDVFPVTGVVTVANATESGKIYYAASTQEFGEDAFAFNEPHSLLIKTQYKVEQPGTAEIVNGLDTLGIADYELTRIVDDGVVLDNNLIFYGTFDLDKEPPTQAPATQAPETQAPETQAPETQAPETQAPETQAPETQAPETQAPETQAPETQGPQTAVVTIYNLDGTFETKEFAVGESFNVYTVLNCADIDGGYIGSLKGEETYTDSILTLTTPYDHSTGMFSDLSDVFPVTKEQTTANALPSGQTGRILFNATTPYYNENAFAFNKSDSILIKTQYTVAEPGEAEVRVNLITLATANEELTRIVDKGQILVPEDTFTFTSSFTEPEHPATEAPVTEAPETQAPETEAPETQAPETQAPVAIVTIYGINGESVTKEFNVGDKFTVYTTLNAKDINDGKIASISGKQTYTDSILALTDELEDGAIKNLTDVFPITGDQSFGNASNSGAIFFNASTPYTDKPFVFDSDECVLIATTYSVTSGGEAEVRTSLKILASADEDLTRIIDDWEIEDDRISSKTTFDDPRPEPTEAPKTEAPETEAPETEAPETEAPETQAPETEAPETQAPETEAPETQAPETQAPTETPTAVVNVYDLDGSVLTQSFEVGKTFDVYITMNVKDINDGKIASLSGQQTYTDSVVALTTVLNADGTIADLNEAFPVTGEKSTGNAATSGVIYFNASTPDNDNAFLFNTDAKVLIKTTYTVVEAGEADIITKLKILAAADDDLTVIINDGEFTDDEYEGKVKSNASFTEPVEEPTQAPKTEAPETIAPETQAPTTVKPTCAPWPTMPEMPTWGPKPTMPEKPTYAPWPTMPVQPTCAPWPTMPEKPTCGPLPTMPEKPTCGPLPTMPEKPTCGPIPTQETPTTEPTPTQEQPTSGSDKATITIYGFNGQSETKEFSIGDTFYVYTTFNASDIAADGMISSVSGSQTYTDILKLETLSNDEMFPIINSGNGVVANTSITGEILYTASTPEIGHGFQFDSDDDCMIVTKYTVTAGGTGEVRNSIQTMAAADDMLTPIVKEGEIAEGIVVDIKAHFEKPGTEPTEEPATEPIVEPTTEPIVEPTTEPGPITDKIIIDADGNKYEVQAGTAHTYSFYLNNGGIVCSLDATTTWDVAGILIDEGQPTFPILEGESLVVNYDNLANGEVIYNYSNADGAYFDEDDCRVITFSFIVPADTQPGIYKIRTNIKTLAGADEQKQIFNGVDLTDFYRKEGVLDGEDPFETSKSYVATNVSYEKGSLADKDFVVGAKDGDNTDTVANFVEFTINGETIDESNYTLYNSEKGELIVTLKGEYLETLDVAEYAVKFIFTDGSVTTSLNVAEPATVAPTLPTPTVAPTTTPVVTPTTVKPSETTAATKSQATTASSTTTGSSTTNSSSVKTGSPEFAIIFMLIMIMAAGIIVFTKKRKND